jgi:acetyltransferase-like isoleucine patch superfamily enzyme
MSSNVSSDSLETRASFRFRLKRKTLKLVAKYSPGFGLRNKLLRGCGYEIGEEVYIGEDLIVVDDLDDPVLYLRIGNRVAISPRVTLVIHTRPNWSRIGDYVSSRKGPITIGDDVWIGTGAVILPDVVIGEGAVVGANAVVHRSVDPYTIVGGVPAKYIKPVVVPWRI